MTKLHVSDIARICHEANRALQVIQDDPTIPVSEPWDNTPVEIRDSAIDGVFGVLEGATPEQSHENWMKFKIEQGYVWGPVKDDLAKIHPLLVPYAELGPEARLKDAMFVAIVKACS